MSHSHDHQGAGRQPAGRLVFRLLLAAVIVGMLVGYSMCFQVSEGYNAVVTRFGKPKPKIYEAGLAWKWPWPIEQVHPIDMRRRLFNTPYTATFTQDQRNVVLRTYVVWRVEDPLLFLQSVGGDRKTAEKKLEGLVTDKKNYYLGRYSLKALVSTNPGDIKTNEIEEAILADVARDARNLFGIKVEQVGIKRVAYPEENMKSVLEQMRAERNAVAGGIRAQGKQRATAIRNDALVQSAEKIKEGRDEAGRIRGAAQAKVAQIWKEAQQWDPAFYRFWRSLEALKKIGDETTTIVLRSDQPIINVLLAPPEPAQAVPLEAGQAEQALPAAGDDTSSSTISSQPAP